ncbi:riboflavin synthase subunit beta [Polaribacter sp. Z014]|uniref:riboflavin synthase subunit beta n=1 Tax=unclassified Polaribacter TaxID=196858 RepID=UPI00193AF055|nr:MULTISPECIES: riboflavin synthase subunit beta [unclassified Polaribacter]MCL7763522.1 riboflavin synthase subunit beta [Polaribacter sp. Z014]QVY66703.1 riboflavin synthase subunit beta [Polaribacter sp. Q13]
MGFLKRTNKKFDYQPRFYKGEGSPFKIEHKLDQFRSTTGKNKGIKGKFGDAIDDLKNSDKSVNKTLFIIIAILVLIFLYIIDFDLSIFNKN